MTKKLFYVPQDIFNLMLQIKQHKEVGTNGVYDFDNGKTSKKSLMTRFSNTCSMIQCNEAIYHIAPEYQENFYKVDTFLSNIIQQNIRTYGYADTIVIGGKNQNYDSEKLADSICGTCKKNGANLTIITLKTIPDTVPFPPAMDAIFKIDETTTLFTQEYNPNMEYDIRQNPKYIIDHLKTYYEKVIISKKHTISAEFSIDNVLRNCKINVSNLDKNTIEKILNIKRLYEHKK